MSAGLVIRRYGGGMPWLRSGLLHYLPVCLLMAVVHQAAGAPYLNLSTHFGVLLFDHVAVILASMAMYKNALYKWDRLPHPHWEGFPIYWREGPEHTAAALSEQLKLMRWWFEYHYWETAQTKARRVAADKLLSEGKLQIYSECILLLGTNVHCCMHKLLVVYTSCWNL